MNTLNQYADNQSRPAMPSAARKAGVKRFAFCATLAMALVSAAATPDTVYAAAVAKAPRHTYSAVAIGIGTLWSWLFRR